MFAILRAFSDFFFFLFSVLFCRKTKNRNTSKIERPFFFLPNAKLKQRNKQNKKKIEMAKGMGIEVNPWQPSPDNPYYSSAAAAAAAAATAAVTNPHNKSLALNPINAGNMTVVAQQMVGIPNNVSLFEMNSGGGTGAGGGAFSNGGNGGGSGAGRLQASSRNSGQGSTTMMNVPSALSRMGGNAGGVISMGTNDKDGRNTAAARLQELLRGEKINPIRSNVVAASGSSTSGIGIGAGGASGGGTSVAVGGVVGASGSSTRLASGVGAGTGKNLGGGKDLSSVLAKLNTSLGMKENTNAYDISSRRIYVGNLPMTVTEAEIQRFFNATMVAAQGEDREPGDSVTTVYLNSQKRCVYVFVFVFYSYMCVCVSVRDWEC